MREALRNLAANAVTYCPAGSTVTLCAAGDPLGWSLRVEDNGPGLTSGELSALGTRFRRGTAASAPGSGLGLSIARSIAERHQGTLRLENREQGRGLIATVWWPRKPSPLNP